MLFREHSTDEAGDGGAVREDAHDVGAPADRLFKRSCGLFDQSCRQCASGNAAMMESFFGTLQLELLDRRRRDTRRQLASAVFECIEAWYNPRRRHTALADLSPVDYERRPTPEPDAA